MTISVKQYDRNRRRRGAAHFARARTRDDRERQHTGCRRARRSGGRKSGKIAGSVHVSRGMLEFRADPANRPTHDKNCAKDKALIVYCASGGRSALAGKALKDMGYDRVYNLGAFKEWAESGGVVDKPIEPSR